MKLTINNKTIETEDYVTKWTEWALAETLMVDVIKLAMKDESDWIGYYIYELDWGEEYKNYVTLSVIY